MNPLARKRIGVILGGTSAEREVSLRSGEAVLAALRDSGMSAVGIHADRELDVALRQEGVQVAFVALRGVDASGPVQGLLETLGIPYTGSSWASAALAGDKLRAKELLRLHNLPTPAGYRHSRHMGSALDQHQGFGFPCVVKPRSGGSGIGVSAANDEAELERAVEQALLFDDDVLVERRFDGREVQVAILAGQVLGVAEITVEGLGVLDYAARRGTGRTRVTVPPRLGVERLRGVVTQALRAHHLLGCSGLTRVDLIVSDQGNECILEVDAMPDLGPGALVPKLAHAARLDFSDLVLGMLEQARLHGRRRHDERRLTPQPWLGPDRRDVSAVEPH